MCLFQSAVFLPQKNEEGVKLRERKGNGEYKAREKNMVGDRGQTEIHGHSFPGVLTVACPLLSCLQLNTFHSPNISQREIALLSRDGRDENEGRQ